jgi:CrcB protein
MKDYILMFIGGGMGTLCRYFMAFYINKIPKYFFPLGTMSVNLVGSFVIGFLWGLFEVENITTIQRNFIFIGFLGGFTTFSSFMLETMNLIRDKEYAYAMQNLVFSNVLGVILVFAGFILAQYIIKIRR